MHCVSLICAHALGTRQHHQPQPHSLHHQRCASAATPHTRSEQRELPPLWLGGCISHSCAPPAACASRGTTELLSTQACPLRTLHSSLKRCCEQHHAPTLSASWRMVQQALYCYTPLRCRHASPAMRGTSPLRCVAFQADARGHHRSVLATGTRALRKA